MYFELSDNQLNELAYDLDELYANIQSNMGQEDLDYINHVKNYSLAIKKHSELLFSQKNNQKISNYKKAIILRSLHKLLEFSIGHVILHGGFDHLYPDNKGKFHSDTYQWDFAVDTIAWKTMHHQNHHPYTNIKGKDHDLGYGLFRLVIEQNWWGHHFMQLPMIAGVLGLHSAYFSLYASYSAGAIDNKPWYNPKTYTQGVKALVKEWYDSSLKQPFHSMRTENSGKNTINQHINNTMRAVSHSCGNLMGNVLGYDYLVFLLLLEHHFHGVAVYETIEGTETKGEYYHRQILATSNFIPYARLDIFLQDILADVQFDKPPIFRVFYEALDTHVEHHLFPDLPGNRLREITPKVQKILSKYGLPYNLAAMSDEVSSMFHNLGSQSLPTIDKDEGFKKSLKSPRKLLRRLYYGMTYRQPKASFYKGILLKELTPSHVNTITNEINDQVKSFSLELPKSWQSMYWQAGAFISLQVIIDGKNHIRQYSLTNANDVKNNVTANSIDFTVKRVDGGIVSHYLHDAISVGDSISLYRKPQAEESFALDLNNYKTKTTTSKPIKLLFIVGGVGITPIMSMLRALNQKNAHVNVTLLYFNRNENSVIFEKELKKLANNTKFLNVKFYFSPKESKNTKPINQAYISKELLLADVPDLLEHNLYICAPSGFIEKTKGYLAELNFDMLQFHTEVFQPIATKKDADASYRYHKIFFAKTGKSVTINENTTLLEAINQAGISVLTGCEKGLCKACVCLKTSGNTSLDTNGHLNKVTVCNAMPLSDVTLDI